jgi:hypothetical protein
MYLPNTDISRNIFNLRLKGIRIALLAIVNSLLPNPFILNSISTMFTVATVTISTCCETLTVPKK